MAKRNEVIVTAKDSMRTPSAHAHINRGLESRRRNEHTARKFQLGENFVMTGSDSFLKTMQ
jgi:hypothetical protein